MGVCMYVGPSPYTQCVTLSAGWSDCVIRGASTRGRGAGLTRTLAGSPGHGWETSWGQWAEMPASSGWLPLTSSSELFIELNSQFTYKRRHTYTVKSCQIRTLRWTVYYPKRWYKRGCTGQRVWKCESCFVVTPKSLHRCVVKPANDCVC